MHKWSFSKHVFGNGSRNVGACAWWNKNRIGLQIAFVWVEFYVQRDF